MEYPFSPKGRGNEYWTSPRAQFEKSTSSDGGVRNSVSEDVHNSFCELMNFDTYAGWCNSPLMTDLILPNGLSPVASVPYPSLDGFNLVEQSNGQFFTSEVSGNYNATQSSPSYGEKVVFQQMDTIVGFSDDANDANSLNSKKKASGSTQQINAVDVGNYIISRPDGLSLDERMLKALSFFKESAGEGILLQVWVPIKHGDQLILTTTEQPYLLDQMLAGYREVSRTFTFSAQGKSGSCPGLPGRVFISNVLEWTSNVGYYNRTEYSRMEHAINHEICGSIAVPVSELHSEVPCCAVLELVTMKEKPDFDRELEIVSHALQVVNLRTTVPPRLLPQCLSDNKRAALTEIIDVLRSVCHAHSLPMALTWIPCYYNEGRGDQTTRIRIKQGPSSLIEKCILCIEESASYISDRRMEGFVHACLERHLEEGKGIAGKALQSNHPFFCPDVKAYDISEYPLVHHARKYNLNAAVAIRLRSSHTGDDDYILEFFLPVNMRGSSEQQLLLDNLSGTVQRICRGLRTVSDAELSGINGSPVGMQEKNVRSFFPMSGRNSQLSLRNGGDHDSVEKMSLKASNLRNNGIESALNQAANGSKRKVEKKRSTLEKKNVSLSLLQQYFSGTLRDAAKSLGVCPTTLKRICRQHGISRWPSRKINKVSRSFKKIQTVLDSVQGVDGGLKFDPSVGAFVTRGSITQEIVAHKSLLPEKSTVRDTEPLPGDAASLPPASCCDGENSAINLKDGDASLVGNCVHTKSVHIPNYCEGLKRTNTSSVDDSEDSQSSMMGSSNGSSSCSQSFENWKHPKFKSTCVDSGSRIIVKATYREDTIRFKFDPSAGCFLIYEEVASRFKLQHGSFQLKYLDDEEEWVMLVNDADLQECVEILDDVGTRSVKFLVRDRYASRSKRVRQ